MVRYLARLVGCFIPIVILSNSCSTYSGKPVFVDIRPLMEVTPSGTPQNDKERLISKALARAVIEERDAPGYDNLPDTSKIVVVNAICLIWGAIVCIF
jgi:hypothetical protein